MSVNEIDADFLAKLCFDSYEKNIYAKNKLNKNEWTNLAAIVQLNNDFKSKFMLKLIFYLFKLDYFIK